MMNNVETVFCDNLAKIVSECAVKILKKLSFNMHILAPFPAHGYYKDKNRVNQIR